MTEADKTELKTEPKADPKAVITVTEEQNAALIIVAEGVKKISGEMLKRYWGIGKLIDDVIRDCANDAKKFGVNAITRLNELTNVSKAELYNMNKVYRRNTEEQIDVLSGKGVFLTHVVHASDIVDDKQRMELLLAHATKESEERLNNKEFKAVVEDIVATKDNQKALKEEQGGAGAPTKGAGIRSGKPKDTASRSAIAAVKAVGSLCEKLKDAITDAIIGLKEFDSSSDKAQQNLVKASVFTAGVAAEVMLCMPAFAENNEEFLANNDSDGRRRRGQASRKDAYVEAADLVEKFVKGFDKTLVAGEKRMKEAEEEAKAEAEKAKEKAKEEAEAAKEKAARAKEKAKEKAKEAKEAKVEKKASSSTMSNLAALRERARKALKK